MNANSDAAPQPPTDDASRLRARRARAVVVGDGSIIQDGAVAWVGSLLVAVGPWRAMRRALDGIAPEGADDDVIVHGKVDEHRLSLTLAELAGEPLETWLCDALAAPHLAERDRVLLASARMLRRGASAVVDVLEASLDDARRRARLAAWDEVGLPCEIGSVADPPGDARARLPRTGLLEPGARADFSVRGAAASVHGLVVGGRELLRDGQSATFDEASARQRARDAVVRWLAEDSRRRPSAERFRARLDARAASPGRGRR